MVLCLCLAELAAMMPDRTGGMPSYASETFKDLGPGVARHLGGISAWGYWLAWFPVAPINMIIAGKYIVELFRLPTGPEFTPISVPINTTVLVIAVAGMLAMFVPCYLGIHHGARFATWCGLLSMAPITMIVFLPLFNTAAVDWDRGAGFRLADPGQASFRFYMSWVFIMSWSVLASEAAACYIGECRDPARDAEIAMTLSGLYGGFIYSAVPLALVLVLGANLADGPADPLLPPLTVFLKYTEAIFGEGTWVRWAIAVPLVLALVFSVLHAIMGCGRALYQVAEDGLLPGFFRHTNRHGVPDFAMAFNLGAFFLFVWLYGGYYAADIAVAEGKRWLFFLGLGIMFLYLPLYAWRRLVEDRRGNRLA